MFGSVARREDHEASDVDVVVVVDAGPGVGTFDIMDIEEILAAELGCKVDVVTLGGLDRVRHADIFRDMTPAFLRGS